MESVKTLHTFTCGSCGFELTKNTRGLVKGWYYIHFSARLTKNDYRPCEDNPYTPKLGFDTKTLICSNCSAKFRSPGLEVNNVKFGKIATQTFEKVLNSSQ